MAFAVVLVAAPWDEAEAVKPPPGEKGNGLPKDEVKVFQFNFIGYPDSYTGNCGSGRRVFVPRDANHSHVDMPIGDHWEILDCNATNGSRAQIQMKGVVGQSPDLNNWVRILGKPGGQLDITPCAKVLHDADEGLLCLLDTVHFSRNSGQPKFSVKTSALFIDPLEDVTWSLSTSGFRVAQFIITEAP